MNDKESKVEPKQKFLLFLLTALTIETQTMSNTFIGFCDLISRDKSYAFYKVYGYQNVSKCKDLQGAE